MRTSFLHGGWSISRAFAAIIVVFSVMTGCSDSGIGSGGTGGAISLAQSPLAHDTNPQVSDTDLASVVSGNTEFALKLFPLLDTEPNDNTFFSPYSITQAFALLAPGAFGTTLNEIDQTLFFTLSQDLFNPAFNRLNLLLANETTGAAVANNLQTPTMNNANALWAQKGMSIQQAYLDTLAVNYGAGLYLVDFENAAETSRQAINNWVEAQTDNSIQNLIPQGGISAATRLVLTNAILFKANWASPFSQQETVSKTFNNRDGSTSSKLFMGQEFFAPYVQADGCQAIDIPYAGNNLSMLVIMPAPGTIDTFLASLTPAIVTDITNQLTTSMQIVFSMPKFSFTQTASLSAILQSLGMTAPFDPTQADFSGIDGNRDLYIGDVFHKAFIDVDEAGTVASAATAIVITPIVTTLKLNLTINYPFIFLIRERSTGLILFMGKVVTL